MNVVFISPHFPFNFYNFTRALKDEGYNTIGIGDEPYNQLENHVKNSMTEYVYVHSLENYDEVYRAMGYIINKYGRIDYLESNNEYWLIQDAKLRTDFNICSGVKSDEIRFIKYKSEMKALYEKAKVPTARYILVDTFEKSLEFAKKVGYPLFVKPDDGVGASLSFKIKNEDELKAFHANKYPSQMIMEEYIDGHLVSFDGLADGNREPVYMTSHVFPNPVAEIVNEKGDCFYYSRKEIPADLEEAGRKVLKAFPSQRRYFHLEFFVLKNDKEGLGKKGDVIGLEVNMRTPGGPTPDMSNYAADIDVYRIWARMLADRPCPYPSTKPKYFVAYCGRRKEHDYEYSLKDIRNRYGKNIVMERDVAPIIAGAMGDHMIVARFENREDITPYVKMCLGDYVNADSSL